MFTDKKSERSQLSVLGDSAPKLVRNNDNAKSLSLISLRHSSTYNIYKCTTKISKTGPLYP